MEKKALFGGTLIQAGVITEQQLAEAIGKQQTAMGKRKIGEILVRLGHIAKYHIAQALSVQLDIALAVPSRCENIPSNIIALLQGMVAIRYQAIPVCMDDDTLVIATSDPAAIDLEEVLQAYLPEGQKFRLVVAHEADIKAALGKYYGWTDEVIEKLAEAGRNALRFSRDADSADISSSRPELSEEDFQKFSLDDKLTCFFRRLLEVERRLERLEMYQANF